MNKKILIISPKFFPSIGGVEEQVKILGKGFIEEGYTVNILTRRYEKNLKKRENIFGFDIFRFNGIFGLINFLLKNKDYDLIISRQFYRDSAILGLLKFLKLINSKTVICTDSGGDNDEINTIKNKLSFLGLYKIYFYFISKNDYLNCLNLSNVGNLKKIYNKSKKIKITRIFNGVEKNKESDKKILKIKNILFLGRLEPEKGIFETIKAFSEIKKEDIVLNIVGYGEVKTEEKILELINNDKRIKFLGKKYGDEKDNIINETDLFVFPTYYPEGQPVVITEMIQKNIPIITTYTGNNKEIYENTLFYVEEKNISNLKNKMEFIIENIDNIKIDYSSIIKKIDIKNITKKFLELIK